MARRKSYIFNSVSISLAALGILFGVALLIFQFIQNGKEVTKIGIKDTSGKVLYISSYDSAYNISDSQKEGLEEVFLENDVILDIVYMDMMNYDTLENYNLFYNSIKYKINSSKIKYDAIVVSDDIALRFAEKYQDELSLWAGGGITIASDCDAEYQECFDKVSAILDLLNTW